MITVRFSHNSLSKKYFMELFLKNTMMYDKSIISIFKIETISLIVKSTWGFTKQKNKPTVCQSLVLIPINHCVKSDGSFEGFTKWFAVLEKGHSEKALHW